jgi:hypothetical protein
MRYPKNEIIENHGWLVIDVVVAKMLLLI